MTAPDPKEIEAVARAVVIARLQHVRNKGAGGRGRVSGEGVGSIIWITRLDDEIAEAAIAALDTLRAER